jgi:hypothetical protein
LEWWKALAFRLGKVLLALLKLQADRAGAVTRWCAAEATLEWLVANEASNAGVEDLRFIEDSLNGLLGNHLDGCRHLVELPGRIETEKS